MSTAPRFSELNLKNILFKLHRVIIYRFTSLFLYRARILMSTQCFELLLPEE